MIQNDIALKTSAKKIMPTMSTLVSKIIYVCAHVYILFLCLIYYLCIYGIYKNMQPNYKRVISGS